MGVLGKLAVWPPGSPFVLHMGVLLDLRDPVFSPTIKRSIRHRKYEVKEALAAKVHIEPGQRILEIGAGCGFLSSYIAKLGRGNTIYCVEANPALISVIKWHHTLNRVTAQVYNEMLSTDAGEALFYISKDLWSSRSTPFDDARRISVEKTRFIDRLDQWRPDCLIMDIEGGELELLEIGLPEFVRTLIVEIHGEMYGSEGVRRVLLRILDLGFSYASRGSAAQVLCWRRG